MPHDDAITQLQRAAGRRNDDGIRDIAIGLLLFAMGVGLDLGRLPVVVAIAVPLIVAPLQLGLVHPRGGYAREPRRFLADSALLFGLSFLALLAIGATIDTTGLTGQAASGGEERIRLATLAAILALPGLLAWIAYRRGLRRYYAYALAIVAAFAVGHLAGLEARAWALALFALVMVAIGALRLRRFVAAPPRASEGDLAA